MGPAQQIRSAQLGLGWTMQELLDRSGLAIDRTTLLRKVTGKARIFVDEIEALEAAIRQERPAFRIVWPGPEQKAAG